MTGGPDNDNDSGVEGPKEDPSEKFDFPEGPGGILSDTDRKFLLYNSNRPGSDSLEFDGDETQKRWRIRQKIKSALHDFQLLDDPVAFPDKELELVLDDVYVREFSDSEQSEDTKTKREGERYWKSTFGWGKQLDHLISAMAFLYRAADTAPVLTFEDLIEEAVKQNTPRYRGQAPTGTGEAAKRVGVDVSIEVDIEWEETLDIEDLEAKLERGEQLTREEVGELFLHGRIESGDLGADDVDPMLFNVTTDGIEPLPALDPSAPSQAWIENMRDKLTEEWREWVGMEPDDEPREP